MPLFYSHIPACKQVARFTNLERLLQVDVVVDGELPQSVADQMIPAYVKHKKRIPGQQRLHGQQHEDVVQVSAAYRHLNNDDKDKLTDQWNKIIL